MGSVLNVTFCTLRLFRMSTITLLADILMMSELSGKVHKDFDYTVTLCWLRHFDIVLWNYGFPACPPLLILTMAVRDATYLCINWNEVYAAAIRVC